MGIFSKKPKELTPLEAERERVNALLANTDPLSREYVTLLERRDKITEILLKDKAVSKKEGGISKDVAAKLAVTVGIFAAGAALDAGAFAPKRGFKEKSPTPNIWGPEKRN